MTAITPIIIKPMGNRIGMEIAILPVSRNSQDFLSATVIQKDKMVKFREENENSKEFILNNFHKHAENN